MAFTNCQTGYDQTLFLGCSVMDFSLSSGFNEQVSELTVNIVEDDCTAPASSPKYYWDTTLTQRTTTDADPGFIGEQTNIIGSPAYFRVADFEFSGLIQSWERINSTSGNPVYSVKLSTPISILEGTQLIIGDYTGGVGTGGIFNTSIFNVINVFGFMESFGDNCPQTSQTSEGFYENGDSGVDGAVFGTEAGAFGGALVNDNGMQWNRIKDALDILVSSVPKYTSSWSPFGRLMQRGTNVSALPSPFNNGYGLLGFDSINNSIFTNEYFLDISELPVTPTYFRFEGTTIGLLDAISRVTQESGYDYFLELTYVRNQPALAASGIAKMLKLRVVSRSVQPVFGAIQSYIDNSLDSEKVLNSSVGREKRSELTSSFIIGGKKQSIYQAEQSTDPGGDDPGVCDASNDMIIPYFGVDSNKDLIPVCKTTLVDGGSSVDFWWFEADTSTLNGQLDILTLPNPTRIEEREIIAAIGDFDTWRGHIRASDATVSTANGRTVTGNVIASDGLMKTTEWTAFNKNVNKQPVGRDAVNTKADTFHNLAKTAARQKAEDIKKIYDWVAAFGNEFYGKKFAVRVPFSCIQTDSESDAKRISEHPTQDGGWTEFSNIIGLPNSTALTDFFRDSSNKITTFARIDNVSGLDISSLSSDDYGTYNGDLYLKADVEEDYVYHTNSTFFVPRAVVTLSDVVPLKTDSLYDSVAAQAKAAAWSADSVTGDDINKHMSRVGSQSSYFTTGLHASIPSATAFGMKSNILTYGPWTNPGPPGLTNIEFQEGLVPWEYSSLSTLNAAGQALANAGITNMEIGEMGNVTLEGYPTLPLFAEINGFGQLGGKHLIEGRLSVSFQNFSGLIGGSTPFNSSSAFFDHGYIWAGSFGPNITSMSVNVGPGGATTTYSMRTYTPKFGKFARLNANRLKQIGQNRMKNIREMRKLRLQNSQKSANFQNKQNKISQFQKAKRRGKIARGTSPHEVFVGQLLKWDNDQKRDRTIISSSSITELPAEVSSEDYNKKAFMSIDGLIRPISMDGYGGLPRYVVPKASGEANNTRGAIGPVLIGDGKGKLEKLGQTKNTSIFYNGTGDAHEIALDFLNPFSNPKLNNRSRLVQHRGTDDKLGHDIDILGREGTGEFETPESGMIMRHGKDDKDYQDDYAAFALRGPILIHGWGFDTDGKPIPNEADNEMDVSGGQFTDENLTKNFLDGWLQKPKTWPVAPIDLRFDRRRGVWVSPPQTEIISIKISESIESNKSGLAEIISESTGNMFDDDGEQINHPMIYAHDTIGSTYAKDDKVMAFFNTYSQQWNVIGGGGGGSSTIIGRAIAYIPPASGFLVAGTIPQNNKNIRAVKDNKIMWGKGRVRPLEMVDGPTGVGLTVDEDGNDLPEEELAPIILSEITGEATGVQALPTDVDTEYEVWHNTLFDGILENSIVIGTTFGGKKIITSVAPTTIQVSGTGA